MTRSRRQVLVTGRHTPYLDYAYPGETRPGSTGEHLPGEDLLRECIAERLPDGDEAAPAAVHRPPRIRKQVGEYARHFIHRRGPAV